MIPRCPFVSAVLSALSGETIRPERPAPGLRDNHLGRRRVRVQNHGDRADEMHPDKSRSTDHSPDVMAGLAARYLSYPRRCWALVNATGAGDAVACRELHDCSFTGFGLVVAAQLRGLPQAMANPVVSRQDVDKEASGGQAEVTFSSLLNSPGSPRAEDILLPGGLSVS
jgi:hypothetical protein